MIKVVVTGGAGFIGSNLTRELIRRGFEVHVVDNLASGKRQNVPSGAIFHKVDILCVKELTWAMKGAEYVFHLAALPRVQFSIEKPIHTHNVNVTGTMNVLIASNKAGVKRVIYSASSSAYGDQTKLPLTEDMLPNPTSPYGAQKYIGEVYCQTWSKVYDLDTISLRYFNVYGHGQSDEGGYPLVIAKFLKQKREGVPLTITGTGEQTRDFTHVSDVVEANILAMNPHLRGNGAVLNIGFGKNISVNQIAKLIGGKTEYIPARLEPKDTLSNSDDAQAILGWTPKVSIEEGIKQLLDEENQPR